MHNKKGLIAEFKEFISRGSVVDLAVGIIIGSAFTAIVNSLVNDIIMPFIGWLMGDTDLSKYRLVLGADNAIMYGSFLQGILNFLLIALVVFIMVKAINKFHRKKEEPEAAPIPDPQVVILAEIRDLLKDK